MFVEYTCPCCWQTVRAQVNYPDVFVDYTYWQVDYTCPYCAHTFRTAFLPSPFPPAPRVGKLLVLRPEEFAALPPVVAHWSHKGGDYDIWLTTRERGRKRLLWVFECPHGRWLLIGAQATVHGPWKKRWNQGVIKLPPGHQGCKHKIYTKPEFAIVENDPLRHFISDVPLKFMGIRRGPEVEVRLRALHPNYEAKLFISYERREAEVDIIYYHLQQARYDLIDLAYAIDREPYEVPYDKALELFRRFVQVAEEEPRNPGAWVEYISPSEALRALEGN